MDGHKPFKCEALAREASRRSAFSPGPRLKAQKGFDDALRVTKALAAAQSRLRESTRGRHGRVLLAPLVLVAWPIRTGLKALDRLVVILDGSPHANTPAGVRLRRVLASLISIYGAVLWIQEVRGGGLFSPAGLLMMVMALALYSNRGGRFLRDWLPIFLAAGAYIISSRLIPTLGVPIHYKPQLEIDRLIGLGSNPTVWLQSHLYHGVTGPLETFTIAMYISHFIAPLVLAAVLWTAFSSRGFTDLFFGILIVSVLGEITFVLLPTAPPWMAGDLGLLPPVHHIIRDGLPDLGLAKLAAHKDEPGTYNLVAAVPSLHAAWPMIGLLVIKTYRLPRWLLALQALQLAAVLFAIVYAGEHYMFDAVAGIAYAIVSWRIVMRVGASKVSTIEGTGAAEESPEAMAA